MTSQPDKLFRDALENFQRPAPTAAWEKIDAGLNKSSNKGLLLKIAAGLLLLCVAGFLLWTIRDSEKTLVTAETNEPAQNLQKNNSNTAITPSAGGDQKIESKNIPLKKKSSKKENSVLLAESTESKNEIAHVAPPIVESSSSVQAVAVLNSTPEQPSKKIVYTAEEVNAKYLRKKTSPEATPETKKASGIQKLMGLAYELKNTNNGLGDLRQKKDEILALNFLNEEKTKKEKN
jgi:hypothetical protein